MGPSVAGKLASEGCAGYPVQQELLPVDTLVQGRYELRFATTLGELDELLQLRYCVFNLELGEGLATSHETGRDLDEFDPQCHHLLVRDRRDGRVVGTYRMQTAAMARSSRGFYAADEFELEALGPERLGNAVEVGRACVDRDHRNQAVLFRLWRGLAAYVSRAETRYLFGCCSLTSQDPAEGWGALRTLADAGHLHAALRLAARPRYSCRGPSERAPKRAVKVPRLFRTYLRFGARVCSEPAIDRRFKTIDFLVLFDLAALDARSRTLFFS
jgi:putative hemolysin